MTLIELQIRAEEQGIEISALPLQEIDAVSLPAGRIAISTKRIKTQAAAKAILAHEIGHCETGSFYNIYSPFDIRAAHERRADTRSYQMLVPHDELQAAVKRGLTEVWELADEFGVPCDYMAKAMEYWQNAELAAM